MIPLTDPVPELFTSESHISDQHSASILDSSIEPILSPTADPAAWSIIEDYTLGVIESFPDVDEWLNEYLGVKYQFTDWWEAFMAIDHAEDDTVTAMTAIKALASKSLTTGPQSTSPATTTVSHNLWPPLPQLDALENDLMGQVVELQKRKCI